MIGPIDDEVLRAGRYSRPHAELIVWEFYVALARQGGHLNRKRDGFPGW